VRYSYQRKIIQKVVTSTKNHPSADWVYEKVRKVIPDVSLGTVYRNLNQLVENGSLNTIQDGSITRYDGNIEPHYHLKCEECNEIIDINFDNIDLKRVVKTKFDFELSDIDITITGKCNKHR
tara:strand:- start:195 stop:560 length:366 start_codon:yes stop_codon:yes gene_type:complete